MKRRIINLRSSTAVVLAATLLLFGLPASAQRGASNPRTDSKILYHNGPLMLNSTNIYLIWYGGWNGTFPGNNPATQLVVTDFVTTLGSSPYFSINTGYTNASGGRPNGELLWAGSVNDSSYSQGAELTLPGIQQIVTGKIQSGHFPLDTTGIYIVLATSDISSFASGFCVPGSVPHHGQATFQGVELRYAFIGNPLRCPTVAAPHLVGPTPNGDFAADGIVNSMAALLSATITNPTGTGWFDRYGLENSTKCQGTFGPTYLSANGARANVRLGARDYLLQQNWVNARKGFCGLSNSE